LSKIEKKKGDRDFENAATKRYNIIVLYLFINVLMIPRGTD